MGLALSCVMTGAHGQLFEADSKRQGNSKMDSVITETERRPHSSVVGIRINSMARPSSIWTNSHRYVE
jgi:hypothetical protein